MLAIYEIREKPSLQNELFDQDLVQLTDFEAYKEAERKAGLIESALFVLAEYQIVNF